jgi:hypothetical protein
VSADLVKAPSRWLEPASEKPNCECHEYKSSRNEWPAGWPPQSRKCGRHGEARSEAAGRFLIGRSLALDLCGACAEVSARNAKVAGTEFWEI